MTIVNEIGGKPFIAMPCTKEQFVMYACFSECNPQSQESAILLIQANPRNSDEMKQFIIEANQPITLQKSLQERWKDLQTLQQS